MFVRAVWFEVAIKAISIFGVSRTVLETPVSVFVTFKGWLAFIAPIRTDWVVLCASTVVAPMGRKEVESLSLLGNCFDVC